MSTTTEAVSQFSLTAGLKLISLGVDIIWTGDDFGTQDRMLISPPLWREVFKPRYAALFSEFKRANPNVKIAYHSRGNIEPVIPDLVEIGLDVLNPLQPRAMDPAQLKTRYGSQLCFWGSVDIQQVLPTGTVRDVEQEVRLRINTMGPGGGFVIAPAHNLQPDTPLQNILAFHQAARRWGRYPLAA